MTQLLRQVKQDAKLGRVFPSRHALERMSERHVTAADVQRAIATATAATEQSKEGTVLLEGGADSDGHPLRVVVRRIHQGLRLITVM